MAVGRLHLNLDIVDNVDNPDIIDNPIIFADDLSILVQLLTHSVDHVILLKNRQIYLPKSA